MSKSIVDDEVDGCEQCENGAQTMSSDKNSCNPGFRAYFVDGFEQILCNAVVIVKEALVNVAIVAFLKRRINPREFQISDPVCERLAAAKRNNDGVPAPVDTDEALNVLARLMRPERLEI